MSELGTIKWGKAASQEMHLGGVYVCRICNMFVEHGSDDCPHSNPPKPAVPPAMQRAPIIEVPNNVNQAQVLVTRMFESLQADVARNHEFVATMMGSLENRVMEQQHFGVMLAELRERQQLIMQMIAAKPAPKKRHQKRVRKVTKR